jgi:hypothetical protein
MAELSAQIDEMVEQGMSAKFIVASLGVPYEWALQAIEQRECLEIEKQCQHMDQEFLENDFE